MLFGAALRIFLGMIPKSSGYQLHDLEAIYLWLSHAPFHSLGLTISHVCYSRCTVTVGDIENFWRQKHNLSNRKHKKSLNYTVERFIHQFFVEEVDKKLQLQPEITSPSANVINYILLPLPLQLRFRFLARNMRKI